MLAQRPFPQRDPYDCHLVCVFDRLICGFVSVVVVVVVLLPDLAGENPSDKINNQQPFLYRSLYERKYEEIYVYRPYASTIHEVFYLRTSC